MKLRQKILLGILIGVLGYYVYANFIVSKSRAPAPKNVQQVGKIPLQQNARRQVPAETKNNIKDTTKKEFITPVLLGWKRDPFYRERKIEITGKDTTSKNRIANLVLNGIMGDGENFIVTINEEFYRKGDLINGTLKVVAVGKNYVVLREDGRDYILRLGGF